jgi:hypothetical protein
VQLSREAVVHPVLEVGSVGETVQVEGSAPRIVTDTLELSTNVSSQSATTLPGLQGAADRMALLSPGVVYGFGNTNSNGLVFASSAAYIHSVPARTRRTSRA